MRDPKRIDVILQEISNIWHKYPDMRLGQLIGNVLEGTGLYYVEDEGLVNALKDMYENNQINVSFDRESYIWDLVKRDPEEIGFVLQEKNYADYISTYTDIGGKAEDAVYTEAEFDNIKAYFKEKDFTEK